MSTPEEARRPFQPYPTEAPEYIVIPYHGLHYRGEAIYADQWDPTWGRPLEGDIYFRIVLLLQRRQVPPEEVRDSRIAVCIPGRGRGRQMGRELTKIRETRTLYLPQSSSRGTSVIRSYLDQQEKALEERLVSEEAARYAGGRIESPTVFTEDIDWFFAGPDPTGWFQRLASALLSWAYPTPPLDDALLATPLSPADVPGIYEAIFAADPEEKTALAQFGPALGLSRPEAPGTFDPRECRIFEHIRMELKISPGELPWADIHTSLAHVFGLTVPVATLYLLAFAYGGQPETQLRLAPEHGITFSDGTPLRGNVLTTDFIAHLTWQYDSEKGDAHIAGKIVSVRTCREQVSWNDALQYTSLMCQGLTEVEEDSPDPLGQERELLAALAELARNTRQAREVLETLEKSIRTPNIRELRSQLNQLAEVCQGADFGAVYEAARASYDDPWELLRARDLVRHLQDLRGSVDEIAEVEAYVEGSAVESGYRQISFDRLSLLAEMSLPVLLGDPRGWPSLLGQVRNFQTRYSRAYASHHAAYQRDLVRLSPSLEESRLRLGALYLLNSIVEVGEPVGAELEDRLRALEPRTKVCDVDPSDLDLTRGPRCVACGVALGEMPPIQELENFMRDVGRALGEQNRRLSRILVDRIIHDRVDQRLEAFLKTVQASDLSALSNTLNTELALFIRRLLSSP